MLLLFGVRSLVVWRRSSICSGGKKGRTVLSGFSRRRRGEIVRHDDDGIDGVFVIDGVVLGCSLIWEGWAAFISFLFCSF